MSSRLMVRGPRFLCVLQHTNSRFGLSVCIHDVFRRAWELAFGGERSSGEEEGDADDPGLQDLESQGEEQAGAASELYQVVPSVVLG